MLAGRPGRSLTCDPLDPHSVVVHGQAGGLLLGSTRPRPPSGDTRAHKDREQPVRRRYTVTNTC
jgi:hypothetical protein